LVITEINTDIFVCCIFNLATMSHLHRLLNAEWKSRGNRQGSIRGKIQYFPIESEGKHEILNHIIW